MDAAVFTHREMAAHGSGPDSPEQPERLQTVLDALAAASLPIRYQQAPRARRTDLLRVHSPELISSIFGGEPEEGLKRLGTDVYMSPGSGNAALRAAGAVTEAVRHVATGKMQRAFCGVRPAGHHAMPAQAMGFCLFANVAIGAKVARVLGFERVAAVDFDVHHGNGTQVVFETDLSLFFASIHQQPLYPWTGDPGEVELGNIVNAVVPRNAPRALWRQTFERSLMPALDAFRPDLILISAGFDAHRRDPLGDQQLEAEEFAWATRAILSVAGAHAGGVSCRAWRAVMIWKRWASPLSPTSRPWQQPSRSPSYSCRAVQSVIKCAPFPSRRSREPCCGHDGQHVQPAEPANLLA